MHPVRLYLQSVKGTFPCVRKSSPEGSGLGYGSTACFWPASSRSPARAAAIVAIGGYQRYLSPYKGYHCAHATLYGGLSCSEYGKQAIQANGLASGLLLLRERFRACHQAAVTLRSRQCSATGPRVEECFESDFDRGKRESQEAKDYCAGCLEGCCSDQ